MSQLIILLVAAIISTILGIFLGYILRKQIAQTKANSVEAC